MSTLKRRFGEFHRRPIRQVLAIYLLAAAALWGIVSAGSLVYRGIARRSLEEGGHSRFQAKLLVMPFENLGPVEDEYFADGLTDEITARLAQIPGLGVISRSTAIRYKRAQQDVQEIGEELDVQYVLEGIVRWQRAAGGESRVRVTPQLIRVSDGTNLWTWRYDAVLSEIFRVQSDVAESVARVLDITLLEPQRRALAARPTEDLEAYDYYLRGNDSYARRFVEEDAWAAVDMYERAVELDGGFAHAYAALTRALVWLNSQFGHSDVLERARTAVDEALRLAPDLVEAHMALGDYYYYGLLDYEQALEQYRWVRTRQPSNSDALALTAWIQRRQADWASSIVNAERALVLDPLNAVWLIGQAQTLFFTRQYEQAEPYFRRAIAVGSDVPYYYRWAAWFYLAWDGTTERAQRVLDASFYRIEPGELLVGWEASWIILSVFGRDYAQALDEFSLGAGVDSALYLLARAQVSAQSGLDERARIYYDSARVVLEARVQRQPTEEVLRGQLGIAYAGLGQREEAIREGRTAVALLPVSRDAMSGPYGVKDLARIYVMVGEHEAAIDQLEYLLSIPSGISAALLQVDPFWDPLRSNARFEALLQTDERRERETPATPRVVT
jgi:TolB-like protein